MWFKYKDCINCLYICLKNKRILHIKLQIINQLFEGGGTQNYVLWPRAQKCVNPALGADKFLAFPISPPDGLQIFLGWVKEIRISKS
jgi:hypothetical protein